MPETLTPPRRNVPSTGLALDRVQWIRFCADGTAVVAGTRRRRPAQVRVDGATAASLVAAGVATVNRPGRDRT